MDKNISIPKIADEVLDFLVLAKNNIVNEQYFLKNFSSSAKELHDYSLKYRTMPVSHIKILIYLSKVESAPVSKISSGLNISKSNTTPIIDKLIEFGLVDRFNDAKDRRIVRVSLTETSKKLMLSVNSILKQQLCNNLSNLSDEELITLIESIHKLHNIFTKIQIYNDKDKI